MSGRRRLPLAWIATLPFFAYTIAFLFLPAESVIVGAFKSNVHAGGWTFSNVTELFHSPYRHAYIVSIEVSATTALIGGVLGFLVAYAMIREHTPRIFRGVITTFSGVAANFGGIPLAFAWIATIGPLGIVTVFFRNHVHYDVTQHLQLFTKTGVEFVYLYFQIPLAILVIAPAIDGLKREWREASSNLGASSWQFWRYVGIPVLMPSMLGMFILLFGNAFAAYATAYALTTGVVPLIPILIGAYYQGNVLDNPHLAQAMAFGMFAVLAVMMVLYIPLQRRAARWAK
ncbi:MAG TPA: ABC transporter permease subunit [Gaiellaceae bacterium]|nr:ABC transporter permease subunit [Gaiellaceae bacterium]